MQFNDQQAVSAQHLINSIQWSWEESYVFSPWADQADTETPYLSPFCVIGERILHHTLEIRNHPINEGNQMWIHGESNSNATIIVLWLVSWLKTALMTCWWRQSTGPHVPFQIQISHLLWQRKSHVCLESSGGQSWEHHKPGLTWTIRLPTDVEWPICEVAHKCPKMSPWSALGLLPG